MNVDFFGRISKILLFEGVMAPLESRTTTGKSSGKPSKDRFIKNNCK